MSLFSLQVVFYLIGLVALLIAFFSWRDTTNPKRKSTALFWGLFGLAFFINQDLLTLLGKQKVYRGVGLGVLALALLAGLGGLGSARHAAPDSPALATRIKQLGHRIFLPALAIPCITVVLTLFAKSWSIAGLPVLDPKHLTLAALVVACLCAWGWAIWLTRASPMQAVQEGRRLTDAIGWG